MRFFALAFLFGAVLLGCNSSSSGNGSLDGGLVTLMPDAEPFPGQTTCTIEERGFTGLARNHVDACSSVSFDMSPPVGGTHYSIWADFKEYDAPVPWGFLVHALEHGALVLAYNCTAVTPECDAVLTAFRAIRAETTDNKCTRDPNNRVIIVPDPTLDVPIAAAAWGHNYRATCLDVASLEAFRDTYYAHGPEDICVAGTDRSSTHWCDATDGGMTDGAPSDTVSMDAQPDALLADAQPDAPSVDAP